MFGRTCCVWLRVFYARACLRYLVKKKHQQGVYDFHTLSVRLEDAASLAEESFRSRTGRWHGQRSSCQLAQLSPHYPPSSVACYTPLLPPPLQYAFSLSQCISTGRGSPSLGRQPTPEHRGGRENGAQCSRAAAPGAHPPPWASSLDRCRGAPRCARPCSTVPQVPTASPPLENWSKIKKSKNLYCF